MLNELKLQILPSGLHGQCVGLPGHDKVQDGLADGARSHSSPVSLPIPE